MAAADWPEADPDLLVDDMVVLPIQVNGKRRSEVRVPRGTDKDEIERLVLEDAAVARYLAGSQPRKLIVVPERIVNVVI